MYLKDYNKGSYSVGAGLVKQVFWFLLGAPLVRCSLIPSSRFRSFLLSLFGAKIGSAVVIKPGVRVKYPWRLEIGDFSWIGEDVWIDNLAKVKIEDNVCISQGAYLCTGNHDWSKSTFDLITAPIEIANHSWIGAKVIIAPGVKINQGAVVTTGSTAASELEAWKIYAGVPAKYVKDRPRST